MKKKSETPPESESRSESTLDSLENWAPPLDSPQAVRRALEMAFDYRGDITLTLKSGETVEGYVFDRSTEGPTLEESFLRLIPRGRREKLRIRCSDVAGIRFSGRDPAAGKSFEAWLRDYNERKARGEKNLSLHPDDLDPS